MEQLDEKVLIVEGLSDKKRVATVAKEPLEIICTNGTIGLSKMDELEESLFGKDVYVLVDADPAGEKLRKLFKQEFPEAKHLYIDREYKEVEAASYAHLAKVLLMADIEVHKEFLS